MIYSIGDLTPKIHKSVFIAPTAVVIGDVDIAAGATIWFGCVLRGDMGKIKDIFLIKKQAIDNAAKIIYENQNKKN